MRHFQKVTTVAAALALALAVSSASAAGKKDAPAPYDFEAEYAEYKAYFEDARRNSKNDNEFYAKIAAFDKTHPKCVISKIDVAIGAMRANSTSKANTYLAKAFGMFNSLPDSPNAKDIKGYYYQAVAEKELFLNNNVDAFEKNKTLCEQNSARYGAELNYLAGGFYFDVANKFEINGYRVEDKALKQKFFEQSVLHSAKARDAFLHAFSIDKDLVYFSNSDSKTFAGLCRNNNYYNAYATFYDYYVNSKYHIYRETFGQNAASSYILNDKNDVSAIPKAILVMVLDFETYETFEKNPDGKNYIAILEESFKKYENSAAALAFIKKFYSGSEFTQEDLNSLPAELRDFMPVRYMYKMKNSNDVAALREEFEHFCAPIGNFYIRLYDKAKLTGDTATMEEIKSILSGDFYNPNGKKNRLIAKK